MRDIKIEVPLDAGRHRALIAKWSELTEMCKGIGINLKPDGSISGKVTGTIRIGLNEAEIVLTGKPFFWPEVLVRQKIQETFDKLFA